MGRRWVAGVRDNSDVEILTFIHLGFRDLMFKGDAPLTLAGIAGKAHALTGELCVDPHVRADGRKAHPRDLG